MLPRALLEHLADGHDHSRDLLCESLALGADEIETQLHKLRSAGLTIVDAPNDELRLADPIDWMEVEAIGAALTKSTREQVESLERSFELESTNRYLLDQAPPGVGKARIALAEYQNAGRGRRGRSWSMPPGSGIALSVSWRFTEAPADIAALSLAVGAMARRAIDDVTGLDVGLKWPNDLIVDNGKLGGILVELSHTSDGVCHVVAGIGVNVRVPQAYLALVSDFGGGARDLSRQAPEWSIDRGALAVALIERLIELFGCFSQTGFTPYRAEWLSAHILEEQPVELISAAGSAVGTVRGIGSDGSLIVEDEKGERSHVISGDVTIRTQSDAGS